MDPMPRSTKPAHSSTLVPFLVLPENRFAFEAISSMGEGKPRPLRPDDRVIVSGIQRVRPGMTVDPKPARK